jgi:mono/diheme cytochrome c family protein
VRNFVLGFLTMSAVLVSGLWGYVRLGLAEVQADVHAPAWERRFMNFAVHASVRRSVDNVQNPPPPTDENLIAGGKLYLSDCSGCHGEPGNRRPLTRAYYGPPPRFALSGTEYSEPELFWIVKHGVRRGGMPSSDPSYTDQQIWGLALFVKQMKNLSPTVVEGIQPKSP